MRHIVQSLRQEQKQLPHSMCVAAQNLGDLVGLQVVAVAVECERTVHAYRLACSQCPLLQRRLARAEEPD